MYLILRWRSLSFDSGYALDGVGVLPDRFYTGSRLLWVGIH